MKNPQGTSVPVRVVQHGVGQLGRQQGVGMVPMHGSDTCVGSFAGE